MSGRRSRSKGARTERGIVNALQGQRHCGGARAVVWLRSAAASPAILFCRSWVVTFASR